MHSKVKQTKISKFGAEKVLLQGYKKRYLAHELKVPIGHDWSDLAVAVAAVLFLENFENIEKWK